MSSRFDLVEDAVKGVVLEVVPITLWRFFPGEDLRIDRLSRRVLEFQGRLNLDLVIFPLNPGYPAIAYGAEVRGYDEFIGFPRVKEVIERLEDWEGVEELDIQEGVLGEVLEALSLVGKGLREETPCLMTIYSPLTIAWRMAGKRLIEDLREDPGAVEEALKAISNTMREFSKATLDYGAHGIFFSTQMASLDFMEEREYKAFGVRYDLPILGGVRAKSFINIVHIHGSRIMFDLIAQNYPVEGINWSERKGGVSLKEALDRFQGVLVGGIDEETLIEGSQEEVEEGLHRSIEATGGRRLILAPGCAVPLNVPMEILESLVKAAREI